MPRRRILLGQIAGAHGIRGDVLITTYTGAPADITTYGPLTDEAGQRTFVVAVRRATPKGVIAHIEGVEDRTAAEALKGARLYVDRGQLPATIADEFYHADLIGLAAVAPDGSTVGTVTAVRNYGAGDLIEITYAESRRTEMIPFNATFVREVDADAKRIVIELPE